MNAPNLNVNACISVSLGVLMYFFFFYVCRFDVLRDLFWFARKIPDSGEPLGIDGNFLLPAATDRSNGAKKSSCSFEFIDRLVNLYFCIFQLVGTRASISGKNYFWVKNSCIYMSVDPTVRSEFDFFSGKSRLNCEFVGGIFRGKIHVPITYTQNLLV